MTVYVPWLKQLWPQQLAKIATRQLHIAKYCITQTRKLSFRTVSAHISKADAKLPSIQYLCHRGNKSFNININICSWEINATKS